MGIFRKPPPEPEPPSEPPLPEPPRNRAIPHRACGGEAKRHCVLVDGKPDHCNWRICTNCGAWGRMKWMPDLATWRVTWQHMK